MLPSWLDSVHHDGSRLYLSDPSPRQGQVVAVRLRAGPRVPVQRILLRTRQDQYQRLTELQEEPSAAPARWFSARLPVVHRVTPYRFVLETGDGVFWYSAGGAFGFSPSDTLDFRIVTESAPPPWVESAVLYSVFLDRFARGPALDGADAPPGPPPERALVSWGAPPPDGADPAQTFHGGDLPGLQARLDHVAALGANALLLSPVCPSPSSHRFDATDHEQVDPALGGDQALQRLRTELTRRAMRYVLTLELRYVHEQHRWFQAARANRRAAEASYFMYRAASGTWDGYFGLASLPRLDFSRARLVNRLVSGPSSVLRRFIAPPFGADGWRFSLPEVPPRRGGALSTGSVVETIRRAVRKTRRDAYIVTRTCLDRGGHVVSDQFDVVTDYSLFTVPFWAWLAGYSRATQPFGDAVQGPPIATEALVAAWQQGRGPVPWSTSMQRCVELASHDLPRIRTMVAGNRALERLAAVVQLTYPGVPVIYYGDEVGLEDSPALRSRGCMPWDEARWDGALLAFYQRLVALRRSSQALQAGGFQVLAAEPDTLAYQREGDTERVIVVAHRGAQPRSPDPLRVEHGGVPDGTRFVEHFSGHEAVVAGGALELPALEQGATVWCAGAAAPASDCAPDAAAQRSRRPTRPRAPPCPGCGRRYGVRPERRFRVQGVGAAERWICLNCGTAWPRETGG
ncbi:MAG: alpha-amylase family glycosyl hydrolase [Anaeromyxobacter sp.]